MKIIGLVLTFCLFSLLTRSQTVKPVTLAQLENRLSTGKDTLYLVNFWATWCVPCVAELPAFEKLQTTLKNEKVKVLLVSMDFQSQLKSSVIPFVKKRKMTTETVIALRKSDQDFINGIDKNWSGALPGTLVVNAKRGIRKFYEKDFTYNELTILYQTSK